MNSLDSKSVTFMQYSCLLTFATSDDVTLINVQLRSTVHCINKTVTDNGHRVPFLLFPSSTSAEKKLINRKMTNTGQFTGCALCCIVKQHICIADEILSYNTLNANVL